MKADGDITQASTHEQKKNELQAKINNLTAAAAQAYRTAGDLSEFVGIVKPLFHEAAEVGANLASRPIETVDPTKTIKELRAERKEAEAIKPEPTQATPVEAPAPALAQEPAKPGTRPLTEKAQASKAAASTEEAKAAAAKL